MITPKVLEAMRKTHANFCRHGTLMVARTAESLSAESSTPKASINSRSGLIYSNLNAHKSRLVKQIKAKRQSFTSCRSTFEELDACLEGHKLIPTKQQFPDRRPQSTLQMNIQNDIENNGKKIRIFTKHIKDGPFRNYFSSQRKS